MATGEKLSDERTIWEGSGGPWAEGPHLYKRKGCYYLLISEGGTHNEHMITAARSKDVWGPYEECPSNPILTSRDTSEYVQYTGHCDMFEDDEHRWWGVCLRVRMGRDERFIMGCETFITPGTWNGDWPTLDRVKTQPAGLEPAAKCLSTAPMVDFLYVRDADLSRYQIDKRGS